MKVLSPCQASQPEDLAKGLRTPRESEGQWNLIAGLPLLEGKSVVHQALEERSSDPTGDLTRPTC